VQDKCSIDGWIDELLVLTKPIGHFKSPHWVSLGVLLEKLLSREIDLRTLASINDDNAQVEEEEEDARRRSSAICRKTTTAWGASRTRDNDDNIPGLISPSSQVDNNHSISLFCN